MKFLPKKTTAHHIARSIYWFAVGFIISGVLLSSALLVYFRNTYRDRVIPGVFIGNTYVGEKTKDQIEAIFKSKNDKIGKNTLVFSTEDKIATVSAKNLDIGYDVDLITDQSLNLGKTQNLPSDVYIILSSYINGVFLNSSFTFNETELKKEIDPIQKAIYKPPVDAQFTLKNNKVVAFQESENGKDINFDELSQKVKSAIPQLLNKNSGLYSINVPVKTTKPNITTEEANDFGIVEPIGVGRSTFYHSIPSRVHNVGLASSRLNGVLIAPGEEFSFVKVLGDVSKFTGYQEAYIISGGKTVLGDGGGVCQVSTTLFRAILDAGLPIVERHSHAYRVGYYEQDQPPGMDATVYVPTVDLKFKNDTGNYILIQNTFNQTNLSLEFVLYGKKDGRQVELSKPVISNAAAAPEPLYQDDPNLPVGTVKQIDFAAPGGKSVFTRKVTKDGKVIINDTFTSVYRPWQAVFLRGTKT